MLGGSRSCLDEQLHSVPTGAALQRARANLDVESRRLVRSIEDGRLWFINNRAETFIRPYFYGEERTGASTPSFRGGKASTSPSTLPFAEHGSLVNVHGAASSLGAAFSSFVFFVDAHASFRDLPTL